MAAGKSYQQCQLRRGESYTTAWIEQRGATVGASVELLPVREMWEVVAVYDHVMPEDQLRETQRANRRSLPSVEPIA